MALPKPRQMGLARRAPRAKTQKICKRAEIANIEQLAHITLHIRGDVVGEPLMRRNLSIEDARIGAGPEHVEQLSGRVGKALEFCPTGRVQLQHPGATSKRLSDRGGEREILRTGKNEPSGRGLFVDIGLQIAEQVGGALHFIDHCAIRQRRQEPARVSHRELTDVKRLETDVRQVWEGGSAECRLAGLSGSGDADDGIIRRQLSELGSCVARDHGSKMTQSTQIGNRIAN